MDDDGALDQMAQTSHERNLIRTTLYVVSPAFRSSKKRSRLYAPEHDHLFDLTAETCKTGCGLRSSGAGD